MFQRFIDTFMDKSKKSVPNTSLSQTRPEPQKESKSQPLPPCGLIDDEYRRLVLVPPTRPTAERLSTVAAFRALELAMAQEKLTQVSDTINVNIFEHVLFKDQQTYVLASKCAKTFSAYQVPAEEAKQRLISAGALVPKLCESSCAGKVDCQTTKLRPK